MPLVRCFGKPYTPPTIHGYEFRPTGDELNAATWEAEVDPSDLLKFGIGCGGDFFFVVEKDKATEPGNVTGVTSDLTLNPPPPPPAGGDDAPDVDLLAPLAEVFAPYAAAPNKGVLAALALERLGLNLSGSREFMEAEVRAALVLLGHK